MRDLAAKLARDVHVKRSRVSVRPAKQDASAGV